MHIKRILDFVLSLCAIVLLSPVYLIVAFLIYIKLGSPVIFSQIRPGKDGRPFRMLKFRTMTDQRDETGKLLPNELRFTEFGKKLRASSLDELPGLINVLKGDMSLVGPRPLLMDYVPLYSTYEKRRMEVKPGLTGWAQVNGRNALDWSTRFKFDVWYVDNRSIFLDVIILFLTVFKVFKQEGITPQNTQAMPRFTGHHSRPSITPSIHTTGQSVYSSSNE